MKIVPINTGDKTRNLKFGMSVVAELEKELGRPISTLESGISVSDLILIMFFGLKWEDKKLQLDQVGDLLDLAIEEHEGFKNVVEILLDALSSSFGKNAVPSKKK